MIIFAAMLISFALIFFADFFRHFLPLSRCFADDDADADDIADHYLLLRR